jgi:hypothetical protein
MLLFWGGLRLKMMILCECVSAGTVIINGVQCSHPKKC